MRKKAETPLFFFPIILLCCSWSVVPESQRDLAGSLLVILLITRHAVSISCPKRLILLLLLGVGRLIRIGSLSFLENWYQGEKVSFELVLGTNGVRIQELSPLATFSQVAWETQKPCLKEERRSKPAFTAEERWGRERMRHLRVFEFLLPEVSEACLYFCPGSGQLWDCPLRPNPVGEGFLLFVRKNADKHFFSLDTVISKENIKLSHKRFLFKRVWHRPSELVWCWLI